MELRLCDAKMFDTAVRKKSILEAGVTPQVGKLSQTTIQWSFAQRTSFRRPVKERRSDQENKSMLVSPSPCMLLENT